MLPSSAEAVSIETNAAAVPAKGPSPAVELPPHALATFGKEPLLARHNLHQNPLFSDESLIELLDRYPRELVYAITMGYDPSREENRLAANDGVTGRDLLEAVKRGRFWLNVTRVNRVDPRFRDLIEQLYGQLARAVPGFEPQKTQRLRITAREIPSRCSAAARDCDLAASRSTARHAARARTRHRT